MLWRNYGIVALLYLVAGCWLIWPGPQNLDGLVVGGQHTDIWSHLWGYWRTERDVLSKGIIPYEEPFLNYPYGGRLYHVDLLNSFYMLPLPDFLVGLLATTSWCFYILSLLELPPLLCYTTIPKTIGFPFFAPPLCVFRFLSQFPTIIWGLRETAYRNLSCLFVDVALYSPIKNLGFYNCIFDDRCPSFWTGDNRMLALWSVCFNNGFLLPVAHPTEYQIDDIKFAR